LDEAADQVSTLKVEIEVKKKEIVVKEADVHVVLKNVQAAQVIADAAGAVVKQRIAEQMVMMEKLGAETKITEDALELAKPALLEAENALKTVKNTDIAAVRKLGKPPHLITVIMDVVLIMFRRRVEPVKVDLEKSFLATSWAESMKVMADTRFLIKIVNYPRDLINAEMVDLMIPYFKYPQYTFEAAKTACGNVAGLLLWTKAMAKYYEINKDVLPLKASLAIQQKKNEKANAELKVLETDLIVKNEEVKKLQAKCELAEDDLRVVKDEAKLYQDKLNAATEMIEGLSEEKINWTLQTKQFEDEIVRLVGDSVILTGFLSYTGPFNQEFRGLMQKHWSEELQRRKIPVSATINLIDAFVDNATVGEWKLQGLPNDDLSTQNGIIVTQATRYPLLIDPQSQGKSWIKNREKESGLVITSLNHKYFRNHFEDAVGNGTPLLIEDVGEDLDPCMDNVLEKNYIKIGNSYKVKVGDKEVDVNYDFRLYITTKLPNPSYTPEIAARTSIIDFTVTMKGLEDQLLGRVILSERKEMEAERVSLISDVTSMKRLKKDLETELLKKLSTASGSLLDDLTVMEVLNTNKEKSVEIREKMATTEVTVENINLAREEFRPVATRGSILYFLIVSMVQVNSMYQTSLVQFLERFDYSLENADKSPITYKRIKFIVEYLTYDIFKYKSRGLYETHKFLFVLLMALNIDLERGKILFEEFQTLIKGGAALDINACPPKPSKWITDMTWLNLVALSHLRQFNTILDHVAGNDKAWKQWFEKNAPEDEPLPSVYKDLDEFRKLLLVRSWCPDRTLLQSRKYLYDSMGEQYAKPFVLNYDELFEESRALSPIICLLSMGSDPTPSIEQLAKKCERRLESISMGQGQEVHARKLILKSLEKGRWVLMQNCHLSLDYMSEVMIQLTELAAEMPQTFHDDFRLWITTECHKDFPITLLQISIKFTNEPPSGVRAGLMKTYRSMSSDIMEYSISKYYIAMIYTISFMHTIVQERRKYGPLGWNVPYEFNLADWLASCYFTQNHLDEIDPKKPEDINWKTVRYMIGEVSTNS
jgi:dynein heavy chain